MGRKSQKIKERGCPRDLKVEGVARLRMSTVHSHLVPALIQQYRLRVAQRQSGASPTPRRSNGARRPFKILFLGPKGKARRAPLKALLADRKGVPAPKQVPPFTGPRNDSATPRRKTIKRSQKMSRRRVALASKQAQAPVEAQNEPVPSDVASTNSPAQNNGGIALDVLQHPAPVVKKAKKNSLRGLGINKEMVTLVQSGGGVSGCGPCTRSRSGRTRSATETLPHGTGVGVSIRCLKTDIPCIGGTQEENNHQKCTTRRSLRKRGSCEADSSPSCEGVTPLLETKLQETSSSGRKRRRLTRPTGDSSILNGDANTIGACLHPSKVAFEGSGESHEMRAPKRRAPQRRRRSRRRRVGRGRGSQAAPQRKAKGAHNNVVQTRPNTAVVPQQTSPPSFLYWPDDPTRPPCHPAVAFEPADLCLGFDGIMEWPCVVADAASESSDCVLQTDEQPRFFLCGGLPDRPRSPPWSRPATSSGDDAHPSASPHHDSADKCAETPCATASEHVSSDCPGETPLKPPSIHRAPAPATAVETETVGKTREEKVQQDDRSTSSSMLMADTIVQPTAVSQEGTETEDDEDDLRFTPPDPETATAIVEYMGETIRRIIATTEAAQRRAERCSRICERLFCVNKPCQPSREQKATEDSADCTPRGCSGAVSRQGSSASFQSHEACTQATVATGTRDHFDGKTRFQRPTWAQEELYCTEPTIQQQPTTAYAAAVSSIGLNYSGSLADLESRLLRTPAFENDKYAPLCLQLLKKYGKGEY